MGEREYLKQFEPDRLAVAFCEACGSDKDSPARKATEVLLIKIEQTTIIVQVCSECLEALKETKPANQEYIILNK